MKEGTKWSMLKQIGMEQRYFMIGSVHGAAVPEKATNGSLPEKSAMGAGDLERG